MITRKTRLAVLGALACATAGAAVAAGSTTERDFLAELPVVLTVSRLAQPQNEAPGAVTVIDREMIRASGVREVADLFRLVPGFQVTYANGANPVVSYHGLSGASQFSQRMQVLVDGRSIYSPALFGGVNWNQLQISLDDIERIEVLRGSNSAAYGSNAFLGVANIVTRDPTGVREGKVAVSRGGADIADVSAQYNGGSEPLRYRVSLERRSDDGLRDVFDRRVVRRGLVHADLRLSARDELELQLGGADFDTGEGFAADPGNAPRTQDGGSHFVMAQWRRSVAPGEEFSLRAYWARESRSDKFRFDLPRAAEQAFGLPPGTGAVALAAPPALGGFGLPTQFHFPLIDTSYWATRTDVELQHSFSPGESLRLVWGGSLRADEVSSAGVFGTDAAQTANVKRVFANLEWRLHRQLVANLGGTWEKDSVSGTTFAPRAMLNWLLTPHSSLRAGITRAYRTPSLLEERADARFVTGPLLLDQLFASSGGLRPEEVIARELGYVAEYAPLGLGVDVRAFQERISDLVIDALRCVSNGEITPSVRCNPPSGAGPLRQVTDFINGPATRIRGLEYLARWRPSDGTRVQLGQAFVRIASDDARLVASAPRRSTSVMLMQRLPGGAQLTVTHYSVGAVEYSDPLPSRRRLDWRLAYPFRIGPSRAELALTVQNQGDPYQEYRNDFLFHRRAFGTLAVEF